MLREARTKLKFKALARLLGAEHRAISALEMLWHATATNTPDGGIGRFSDDEIELELGWEGERGVAVAALVQTRWIDAIEGPARLYVHDWHDHADYSTHRKLARAHQHFANGEPPKFSTLPEAERKQAREFYEQHASKAKPARKSDASRSERTRESHQESLQGQGQEPLQEQEPKKREEQEAAPELAAAPAKPPWGPLANALSAFGAHPPPEDDERTGWLESFWPEIQAAAEAEAPADATRKQVSARERQIALARWRTYLRGERSFRDHAKRERVRLAMEQFERDHPPAGPEEAAQYGLRPMGNA